MCKLILMRKILATSIYKDNIVIYKSNDNNYDNIFNKAINIIVHSYKFNIYECSNNTRLFVLINDNVIIMSIVNNVIKNGIVINYMLDIESALINNIVNNDFIDNKLIEYNENNDISPCKYKEDINTEFLLNRNIIICNEDNTQILVTSSNWINKCKYFIVYCLLINALLGFLIYTSVKKQH